MNERKPGLHWHAGSKCWYIRFAGRCRYKGAPRSRPPRAWYAEQLVEWAQWRAQRHAELAAPVRPRRAMTIIEVAELFLDAKAYEVRPLTLAWYRGSLRVFLGKYGHLPVTRLHARLLNGYKLGRLDDGLAPKSVVHEVVAVKAMVQWAVDFEYCQAVNLRAVKLPKLPKPKPKGYALATVREMLAAAQAGHSKLAPWIAVNWLTAARPSEMVRVVHGEGEWIEPGVFDFEVGKTRRRWLVCSELALLCLQSCSPHWSRADSYCAAINRLCGPGGPHPLRHGAATHLHRACGVDRATVDLFLGHYPPRVSVAYTPIHWQALRAVVARLTL